MKTLWTECPLHKRDWSQFVTNSMNDYMNDCVLNGHIKKAFTDSIDLKKQLDEIERIMEE